MLQRRRQIPLGRQSRFLWYRGRMQLQSGLPTAIQSTTNLGDTLELHGGSVIPSQEPPDVPAVVECPPYKQPDQRYQQTMRRMVCATPLIENLNQPKRRIVHPGGLKMRAIVGRLNGLSTGAAPNQVILQLVLRQHDDRKRFILCNPDVSTGGSGQVIYYCYSSAGQEALLPIYPGQEIDESGSMVSTDEIWLGSAVANAKFIAYEGRLTGSPY